MLTRRTVSLLTIPRPERSCDAGQVQSATTLRPCAPLRYSRGRASAGAEPEPGRGLLAERQYPHLRRAARKGPSGSANEPQTGSTRLEFDASPISLRNRLLFLTGLRGRPSRRRIMRSGRSRSGRILPLSRRSARTARPDRRSEGGTRKSDRGRPGRVRHIRPRASAVVPVGRPRPPTRRSAQGGVGGMTASRRLAAVPCGRRGGVFAADRGVTWA
jgi:hypothetical protein